MSKRWSISSVKKTYVCAAISLIGEIQGLNLVPNFPHEQKFLSYWRNPSICHVLLNNEKLYIKIEIHTYTFCDDSYEPIPTIEI